MHCRNGGHASTSGTTSSGDDDAVSAAKWTAYAAPAAVVLGLGLLVGGGIVFKSQLRDFIDYFVGVVETWGPLRCALHPISSNAKLLWLPSFAAR